VIHVSISSDERFMAEMNTRQFHRGPSQSEQVLFVGYVSPKDVKPSI
jgi:hypothetical protein